MTQILFEKLEKANLLRGKKIKLDVFYKMSFSNILDIADEISSSTIGATNEKDISPHIHSASLSLGGGRYGCSSLSCRKNKLDEIARFAALYSDKVFIHNFVSGYAPTIGHPPEEDSDEFREAVIDDLNLLVGIRPLVESGTIRLFTPITPLCPVCFAEKVFGSKTGKRIKSARNLITKRILDKLTVEVEYLEDYEYPYHTCDLGIDDIFGHSIHKRYLEIPEFIQGNSNLIERVHNGEKILLSKPQLANTDYVRQISSKLLRSCTYHLSVSNVLETAVVTDSDVDADILSYITNNEQVDRRNRITAEHLKAIVPFAGDVPISKLLKLRERENDSFIQFRSALNKSINEVSKQKGDFTVRDAKILHADVIAPEISRLDKKVSEAKKDLLVKPLASAVGTMAVIAFGAYAGMLPSELTELAGFLGVTKTIYDTAEKITELADTNKAIRPEEYYYIWKVKHMAK